MDASNRCTNQYRLILVENLSYLSYIHYLMRGCWKLSVVLLSSSSAPVSSCEDRPRPLHSSCSKASWETQRKSSWGELHVRLQQISRNLTKATTCKLVSPPLVHSGVYMPFLLQGQKLFVEPKLGFAADPYSPKKLQTGQVGPNLVPGCVQTVSSMSLGYLESPLGASFPSGLLWGRSESPGLQKWGPGLQLDCHRILHSFPVNLETTAQRETAVVYATQVLATYSQLIYRE